MDATIRETIEAGRAYLGIELGSTRIKAVLIGEHFAPIASGGHTWENRYENGMWTYALEDVWGGLRDAYAGLAKDVAEKYGVKLASVAAMGVSGICPLTGKGSCWRPSGHGATPPPGRRRRS